MHFAVLLILLFSIIRFKSTEACREPGAKIYENKCYFLSENFKGSQCECEKYCEDKGNGTLACVKSKEHQLWIHDNFPQHQEDSFTYIGLYKIETTKGTTIGAGHPNALESKFAQTSRSCANDTEMYLGGFRAGEPNNYMGRYEGCVAYANGGAEWIDIGCDAHLMCLCEEDSLVNPKYTCDSLDYVIHGTVIEFIIHVCLILPIVGVNFYFCSTRKSTDKDITTNANLSKDHEEDNRENVINEIVQKIVQKICEEDNRENVINEIVPRKIDTKALTGLRGVVALHIAIGHYSGDGLGVDLVGGASLPLFYILSGYIMTIGYASKLIHPDINQRRLAKPLNKKRFMVNRIARLFPLYWFTNLTIFPFILMPWMNGHDVCDGFQGCISPAGNLGVTLLLQNMWLIPFNPWLPMGGKVPMPLNGVTWTIQTMFMFYIIFPYVIPFLATLRNRVKNLSVAVDCLYYLQMIIFFALFIWGQMVSPNIAYWTARAFPPGRTPLFMMGCVLALRSIYGNENDSRRICCIACCRKDTEMMDNWKGIQQQNEEEEERKMRFSAKEADRVFFFICMIYLVAICFRQEYAARVILEPTIPIAFAGLIVHLTNAGEGKGIVNKFCRSKYGQFIGRISMSLYLIHMMIFRGFFDLLFPALREIDIPLRILILVLLLLLTGALSYRVLIDVEDPCRKKIRRLIPADDAVLIRQSVPSTTPGEEPSPIGNSPGRYKVLISDSTPL